MTQVLRLSQSGFPSRWISFEEAIAHICKNQVVWDFGEPIEVYHGGLNSRSQQRTIIAIPPVMAVKEEKFTSEKILKKSVPTLTNKTLFERDHYICMYCGEKFPEKMLTRDHIHPRHLGGEDKWTNVVTACKSCNHHKGHKTLDELKWYLLAVPYEPNRHEYLFFMNARKVLADQMVFLESGFKNFKKEYLSSGLKIQ